MGKMKEFSFAWDTVAVGQRIRLVYMDDPYPIPKNTEGVVKRISRFDDWMQLEVEWIGVSRSLMLCYPTDLFQILGDAA